MPTAQLNSSAIRQLDYDEKSKTLLVHFTSGTTQKFTGIEPQTYAAFVASPSAGRFYHEHIKGRSESPSE